MNASIKLVLVSLFFASCQSEGDEKSNSAKVNQDLGSEAPRQMTPYPETPSFQHPVLVYETVNERGILQGSGMEILDSNFETLKDIDDYNELIVDIVAVSKNSYNHYKMYNSDTTYKNPCGDSKYVKVKSRYFEGLVKGEYVYRILSDQTPIKTSDRSIELFVTANYSEAGKQDEYGRAECVLHHPIFLRNTKTGYEGFIKLLNGKDRRIYFPYLEMNPQKNAVEKVKLIGETFELTIPAKFEISENKGDDPDAPELVIVHRENNGSYTAYIPENN